jgi:zinc protease
MAHVVAVTDGLPDVHAVLVEAFIRELERLAATAVADDELRGALDTMRADMGTSRGAAQRVVSAAHYAIMGKPVATVASWREGLAAVSAAEVQQVAEEASGSSLFVLPPKHEPHRLGFTHLDGSAGPAVAGRSIRSSDYPLDQARLVIGEDGVSLVQGKAVDTVRYAQCAALLTWPDGGHLLIGRDAVSVSIEPTMWRLKGHAARLEEKVGAERSVAMPYRPSERVPRPWTSRPTRLAGRILAGPTTALLAGTVPIGVLLTLLALLVPGNGGIFVLVLVLPAMAAGGNVAKRARARLLTRAAQRNAERR